MDKETKRLNSLKKVHNYCKDKDTFFYRDEIEETVVYVGDKIEALTEEKTVKELADTIAGTNEKFEGNRKYIKDSLRI